MTKTAYVGLLSAGTTTSDKPRPPQRADRESKSRALSGKTGESQAQASARPRVCSVTRPARRHAHTQFSHTPTHGVPSPPLRLLPSQYISEALGAVCCFHSHVQAIQDRLRGGGADPASAFRVGHRDYESDAEVGKDFVAK